MTSIPPSSSGEDCRPEARGAAWLPPTAGGDRHRRTAATAPFDSDAFVRLADDMGSRDLAAHFLVTFTEMLGPRIARIEQALKEQDKEELTTALLSLRSSAVMVGATQILASTTQALADGAPAPAGPLVRRLQGQAHLFTESTEHIRPAATAPTPFAQPRRQA